MKLTNYDWLNNLPSISLVVGVFLFVVFAIYASCILRKVRIIESEIFKIQREINDMEKTVLERMKGFVAMQSIVDKRVAYERKPLYEKLEELKMKRQFLLDRISIFGLIKK